MVEVGALVEQTLELVAARAAAARVTVALDPPAGPIRCAVDPGQLRQVVLNLVLNALDVVKTGGRVEVQLRQGKAGELTLRRSPFFRRQAAPMDESENLSGERGYGLEATRLLRPRSAKPDHEFAWLLRAGLL